MASAEKSLRGRPDRLPLPGPTFRIRPAGLHDVEEVAAIEGTAFSNPWQPQTFRSLISQGRAHVLVAEDPDLGVIGYAVLWWVLDQGELANLAVLESHQGGGVGSALLDRVLEDARAHGVSTVFLEVRTSNSRALALYLSRGFVEVGLRKDYYRKPMEDARVLSLQLQPIAEGEA